MDIKQRLGFRRQPRDSRDFRYAAIHAAINTLPPRVDLRSLCPPVVDQQSIGSCTANAIGAAHHFAQLKQKPKKAFAPSRLFIYYNERASEGTVNEDAGAIIRDGFKSIAREGVCSELLWKYNIAKFTDKPSSRCYTSAAKHIAIQYMAVGQTLNELKASLADGFPVTCGIMVYASLGTDEAIRTGVIPMPAQDEELLGGHAILLCGFDDAARQFIFRNSWGESYGDKGYGYLPYDYITNPDLTSDFWTIRLIKG